MASNSAQSRQTNSRKIWLVWIASTFIACSILGAGLFTTRAADHPVLSQVRKVFVPGRMTSGHHQIELACESCHTSPFAGREELQKSCVRCHGDALTQADDKHPLAKFTDPRNAELLAHLDARECVTCHVEHQPQITTAMGLTQPKDVCVNCHSDIATDRPSHKDMKFDTCASSGCHNFHDNRALYEDFLLKHAGEPKNRKTISTLVPNFLEVAAQLPNYPIKQFPLRALTENDADAKRIENRNARESQATKHATDDWLASAHAKSGVNCSACHQPNDKPWNDHPDTGVCSTCHSLEQAGFLSGKHGMRVKEGLSPMSPTDSQLPFKSSAAHSELTCTSCHGSHRFDVKFAATDGCLQCHNDDHSVNYRQSPHATSWQRELAGQQKPGTGVSCASCHMPRVVHEYEEFEARQTYVEHNQNATLRPNDKMLRPVCMNCHGLAFSIDALADKHLIENNFSGDPMHHVNSIDMALKRLQERPDKKKTTVATK